MRNLFINYSSGRLSARLPVCRAILLHVRYFLLWCWFVFFFSCPFSSSVICNRKILVGTIWQAGIFCRACAFKTNDKCVTFWGEQRGRRGQCKKIPLCLSQQGGWVQAFVADIERRTGRQTAGSDLGLESEGTEETRRIICQVECLGPGEAGRAGLEGGRAEVREDRWSPGWFYQQDTSWKFCGTVSETRSYA